jgi:hypothetical protein
MQNLLHIKAISNKQINIINHAITTNTLSIIIIITLRFPWFLTPPLFLSYPFCPSFCKLLHMGLIDLNNKLAVLFIYKNKFSALIIVVITFIK